MRRAEEISSARGCGLHDHVCWTYSSEDAFAAAATEFAADGLAAGARVGILVPGEPAAASEALCGLGDVASLVADGRLFVDTVTERYACGEPFDPEAQLARCVDALDEALADGFTGLRIVADVTPLVAGQEQLADFVRYEQLVDRLAAERPLSALCAYDRRLLTADELAQCACVHPLSRPGVTPFALAAGEDGRVILRGELDVAGMPLLARALAGLPEPASGGGRLAIDAHDLAFADHRALLALERHARDRGTRVVLQGATPTVGRVAQLLELASVEVEIAA